MSKKLDYLSAVDCLFCRAWDWLIQDWHAFCAVATTLGMGISS